MYQGPSPLDIPELLGEIIKQVDDPKTFMACLRVNKEWSSLAKELIPLKKKEFTVVGKIPLKITKDGWGWHEGELGYSVISCYPNGMMNNTEYQHDEEKNLRRTIPWTEGKRHGAETIFDPEDHELTRVIPWRRGLKHGHEIILRGRESTVRYWDRGNLTTERSYDTIDLKASRLWISNLASIQRNYLNHRPTNMVQMVKGHKHGWYDNGLYWYGVKQPWWDNWWSLGLTLALSLLLVIFLIFCFSDIAGWSLYSYVFYLLVLWVPLVALPVVLAVRNCWVR